MQMSRRASFAIVVAATLGLAACGEFGSDSGAATPSDPDAGTTPDSGLPPVGGGATRGITVTAGEAGKTAFVMQSKTTTVPIKLDRRSASVGPVLITVTGLPKDATVDPLTIAANAVDGTLTVRAASTTPQGTLSLDVTALEQVPNGASGTAKLAAFVRGLPGTLDTTFGTNGVVNDVFGASDSTATSARITQDGSIVVSGRRATTLALARFTTAGVLDLTFAGGLGRASVGAAQGSLFLDIHEGKTPADGFISAVSSGTTSASVFRAKLDGLLNTTFGGTGSVSMTLGLGNYNGRQTSALADGTALVLTAHVGTTKAGVVSRWKANGALDTTYGAGSGVCQLTASGTSGTLNGVPRMFVKADGSARVVLSLADGTGAVKGCTPAGLLDTTLGSTPDYVVALPGLSVDAAPYFDGGIVALRQTAWSRVNAAFVGDTALANVPLAPITSAVALITQADGGIVVVGAGDTANATLVRFKLTGLRDPDFGTAGVSPVSLSPIGAIVYGMVAQPDGRILVFGSSSDHFDGVIARVWP